MGSTDYSDNDNAITSGYPRFCAGIAQFQQAIPVCRLSPNQVSQVLKRVLDTHPEFFWFDGRWMLSGAGEVAAAVPQYLLSSEQAAVAMNSIDATSNRLLARARERQIDPFETAKFFFEWLLSNAAYGSGQFAGQTIYDALIAKEAVCKGLSKAYQFLLQKAGIPVGLAEGTIDGKTKHLWNIVDMNAMQFNVDVSMGYDCFSFLFHGKDKSNPYRCFMISDDQLFHTHRRF